MTITSKLDGSKMRFLVTGLAGSLLVNLSAQFISVNAADIQGGVFASADEASWISTVYTMTGFAGIAMSVVFIRALGIGRYLVVSSLAFGATAFACAMAPDLSVMIVLRAVQGFVAGGFGPAAFVAVFMTASGPLLPLVLAVFASVLLMPGTLGPVVSALVEGRFGWQALFLVQSAIGAALASAAHAWAPRPRPDWSALKTDWVAIFLLSASLAAAALVFSQGTRRFWFESEMIVWCTAGSIGAMAGYIFVARFSSAPIMQHRMLVTRGFGVPIWLNTAFRAGLVVTAYLVPQFLVVTHGYRPTELAELLLWALVPQLLALPLAWGLIQILDARVVIGLGLGLCALGAALVANGTALFAGEQFALTIVISSVGQVLFLTPILVVGASPLTPAEAPTASLTFNMSTLGGTTVGIGLASNLITEREKFHSNIITQAVSLYDNTHADRVASLAGLIGDRVTDDAMATVLAVARLGAAARREAWVLAYNDAFLVVAILLAVCMLGVIAIARTTPLAGQQPSLPGETP
jgi:DHA2 family multidrug resistance protein